MEQNKKTEAGVPQKKLIKEKKIRYLAVWRTDKMIAHNFSNVDFIKAVGIVEGSTLAEAQEAALKMIPGTAVFPTMYELDNITSGWKLELI